MLKSGNVFGIFPEGTCSSSGEMGEVRKGVGLIAYLSHALILPMAIYNSKKVPRENRKKNLFLKIKIIFGDLINTEEIILNYSKKEAIEKISDI
ncbi:MAG: lysophospholipid acyltransferase family protein, partial [Candidatus Humimicrobiaceae bacterium]